MIPGRRQGRCRRIRSSEFSTTHLVKTPSDLVSQPSSVAFRINSPLSFVFVGGPNRPLPEEYRGFRDPRVPRGNLEPVERA